MGRRARFLRVGAWGTGGRGALERKHLPGGDAQGRAVLHGVALGAKGTAWAGDVSEVQGRADAGSKKPAP